MLNVAVLGTGFGGEVYAQALLTSPVFRLTVVFDREIEMAREMRKKWGFKEATDDWKEAIANRNVNLVLIATPAATHFEMARYALELKRHVVISPPFTMNVQEAEELSRMVEQNRVIGMVDFQANYIPARRYVIDLLKSGKAGVLHNVERTFRSRETLLDPVPDESRWKVAHAMGGGLFWDLVPHDIDYLLRAVGGIHSVQGMVCSNIRQRLTANNEPLTSTALDSCLLQVKFHSGVNMQYSISSSSPMKEVNEYVFHGSAGSLFLQNDAEIIFYPRNGSKERIAIPPKYHLVTVPGHKLCTPFYALAETMASAIYNKAPASPTFDEAIHSQRVIDAILASSGQIRGIELGADADMQTAVQPAVPIDKIF